MNKSPLGSLVKIRTGKLDVNAGSLNGAYPFFTCSKNAYKINSYSYDCKCVLVAGNGDLNVKYYEGKFDAYQRTYIIESLDESVLNTKYLYWFLYKYVERLRQLSIGGVIKYIKLNNITDPEIPLLPLSQQKNIISILDQADILRQKRKEAIDLLDQYLISVFLEMFGDIENNPLGWEITKLEKITKKITDGTHQPPKFVKSGIPFIFISNIVDNKIDLNTKKFISEETYKQLTKRTLIEKNDILYTTVGSYGNPAIVKTNEKFCFQRHIAHIKPDHEKTNVYFLFEMLKSPSIKLQADKKVRGIAQKTLNLFDLKQFKVFIPPIKLQNEFAQIVLKTERLKHKMLKQSVEFDNQFQALMQKYFNPN